MLIADKSLHHFYWSPKLICCFSRAYKYSVQSVWTSFGLALRCSKLQPRQRLWDRFDLAASCCRCEKISWQKRQMLMWGLQTKLERAGSVTADHSCSYQYQHSGATECCRMDCAAVEVPCLACPWQPAGQLLSQPIADLSYTKQVHPLSPSPSNLMFGMRFPHVWNLRLLVGLASKSVIPGLLQDKPQQLRLAGKKILGSFIIWILQRWVRICVRWCCLKIT